MLIKVNFILQQQHIVERAGTKLSLIVISNKIIRVGHNFLGGVGLLET